MRQRPFTRSSATTFSGKRRLCDEARPSYLVHIAECVERIESYTAEGRGGFLADTKTQDAVLRNLEIIAEATKRLSHEAKAVHPEIELRGIIAMRNFVLHEYPDVNPERVWEVVEQDLPQLKKVRPPKE